MDKFKSARRSVQIFTLVALILCARTSGGSLLAQEHGANMLRGATFATIEIFDPRIAGEQLKCSILNGHVIVDGDVDFGTVDDVLKNSWALALGTARQATSPANGQVFGALKPDEQTAINLLAAKRLSDLPRDQPQAKSELHKAIVTLRPLQQIRQEKQNGNQRQAAVIFEGAQKECRWKDGKIPYLIDASLQGPERAQQKQAIEQAIAHWGAKTQAIKLLPIDPAQPLPDSYVRFVAVEDGPCLSDCVGHRPTGGVQTITLASGCGCPQVIHEIGHVVGLFHEQCRNDRGKHLIILDQNCDSVMRPQFATIQLTGEDIGPFDFASIMLYPPKAFSNNGRPTMVRKRNETDTTGDPTDVNWGIATGALGGVSTGLSDNDVSAVKKIYAE
jgi:hypothetical protein